MNNILKVVWHHFVEEFFSESVQAEREVGCM